VGECNGISGWGASGFKHSGNGSGVSTAGDATALFPTWWRTSTIFQHRPFSNPTFFCLFHTLTPMNCSRQERRLPSLQFHVTEPKNGNHDPVYKNSQQ
jgi:hypothetical protein